jgi:hypothetical protein
MPIQKELIHIMTIFGGMVMSVKIRYPEQLAGLVGPGSRIGAKKEGKNDKDIYLQVEAAKNE